MVDGRLAVPTEPGRRRLVGRTPVPVDHVDVEVEEVVACDVPVDDGQGSGPPPVFPCGLVRRHGGPSPENRTETVESSEEGRLEDAGVLTSSLQTRRTPLLPGFGDGGVAVVVGPTPGPVRLKVDPQLQRHVSTNKGVEQGLPQTVEQTKRLDHALYAQNHRLSEKGS